MESTELGATTPSSRSVIRRIIRPRFLIGLVVASAGIAAVAFAVVFYVDRNGDEENTGELLQAPVVLGELVDSVSSDGSIVFPERSAMSFGTAGTVDEVLVSVGDTVVEGQELASLDPLTISNLSANVAEARAALENATEKLQDATEGASALEIANAQKDITNAQAEVDALIAQPDREILDASAAVTKAEISLVNAQEALADLESNLEPQAIADAEVELALAIDAYDGAVAERAIVESDWATTIEDATTAVEDARTNYITAFEGWFGVVLSAEETSREPVDILTGWGATYESIFVRDVSASLGTDTDDPATPWNEFTVSLWTRVFPFGVEATCDSAQLASDVRCVQQEIETDWDAIATAEDALARTTPDRADAITAAMKVISTAENAVQSAEDDANFSTAPTTALNLQAAADAVSIAESDVTAATVTLATLTSGDLEAKSSALVIAEAELAEAQSHLTDITTTDQTLVALRTSEIDVATAQLDNAIDVLDNAVLKSPVNGIVDLVNFDRGDEVPRTAVIVEIIDPSVVTVEMDVAQVDILAVAIGAEASLTLDALPGQILTGIVTDIGAASGGQQGSVTFPVVVTMQVPPGIALIEGLTANAQMITSTRSNVLLVPSVAVGGSFTQPSIEVMRDGEIRTVNVSLDGGNDTFAVIGSGVVEGDVVLFRLPGVTDETNPFNVIRAGIGGGFTGGFTRGGGGGGGGFQGGGGGGLQIR